MKKKIASLLMMAGILAMGSASVQSEPEPEKGPVTICYYGVTMKVSQKIANRYYKIGAVPGACGEEMETPL